MPRPIRAVIDLDALRNNLRVARVHAGAAKVWAVVKANAYGHGLVRCARAMMAGVDGFAMLDFAEAETLRLGGITHPLLMLEGAFGQEDVEHAARLDLRLTVHCEAQLRMLEHARLTRPVSVFLKLNTGMNRLGFDPAQAPVLAARLRALDSVRDIAVMTHFARADDEAGIATQLARFDAATASLDLPQCVANSAALLRFPRACRDGVRPGIMLYGGSPMPETAPAESLGLLPVMQLESRIIGVQDLQAGDAVGYGGLFTASGPMRVGVVACGYADGYPRHAPTGTPILVSDVRTRTLGRVSMDMLACDLTDIPQAGLGAPVVLWGRGLPADDVAAAAGTLSYELFCALAWRVPVDVRGV